jgi:hypothetical protein
MKTPEYGTPTPLSAEDVVKLREMDQSIWKRSKDRFGHTHAFPKDNRALSEKDQEYVLDLIGQHVLPCSLRSGPYGELSFSVFNHSEMPDIPPERVISLSEEHFGLKGTFETWMLVFNEMSKVTHSQRNREVLAYYQFNPPGPASDYEY